MSRTAKTNAAQSLEEKASRDAACGFHGKAAEAWMKAAGLHETLGEVLKAERAWRKVSEHAQKRCKELAARPKFVA